jgi:hypothetical protein
MVTRTPFLWVVAALLGTLNCGCGTSGSEPTLYPEVQFEVDPVPAAGPVTFRVEELVAGGVRHTFPADTVFTATAPFFFYFENAPPPYSGTFTVLSGGNITVTLFLPGPTEARHLPGIEVAPGVTTVSSGTMSAVVPPTQEIRFDVCVQSLTSGPCFTGGDPGGPAPFSGSVGDALQTHQVNGYTPSIYFLEEAQDNANGVFYFTPASGQTLVVQLLINGALEETGSSNTTDAVRIQHIL